MYKMFIVIALWCELMNKYILSIWSVFFGTFDNMTQVTSLRSCSCSSDALLSTCHCTIRSLLHTEDSLSFPPQRSPLSSPTHVCGSRGFEDELQEAGPELRQRLVQVEGGAPVVLPQVRVEASEEPRVLGVEGTERRQRLLQGALGATVQLREVG